MPLEIRELHFKITIDDSAAPKQRADIAEFEKKQEARDRAFLQACVERVLEILKERNER